MQDLLDISTSGCNGMLFVGENFEDEGVFSLSFSYKFKDDKVHIFNVGWQEEMGSIHNVCSSRIDTEAIYDIVKDQIIQDVYLHDKYGDGSDGNLSDRLGDFFLKYPQKLETSI